MHGRALLITITIVIVAAVASSGCAGSPPSSPGSTKTTTFTATNPSEADYDWLRDIERRHPERIPTTFQQEYSWAFDPTTGRLPPLDEAYTRARKMGIVSSAIWASYVEMVDAIRSQSYAPPTPR